MWSHLINLNFFTHPLIPSQEGKSLNSLLQRGLGGFKNSIIVAKHYYLYLLIFGLALILLTSIAFASENLLPNRWVYIQTNLLVDKNIDRLLELLERASKAGYNGVAIADSKFMRWDNLPDRYAENARKVREACRQMNLAFVTCVFPIGYSNDLLSRDPNLAEGLPVVDAPFIVKDNQIIPTDEPVDIKNPGFEEYDGDTPKGWGFVDKPGEISFIDTDVKYEGKASLRMQDIDKYDPQHGHGRVHQRLKVRPFTYYHLSVMIKTEDFDALNDLRIALLVPDGPSLNHRNLDVKKTQDWQKVDITFNSLNYSEVNFYLGVWQGKGGKIWWDDVRIEPAGMVNVIRREGTPLKITSEDGKITYIEGKDFDGAKDPKLGVVPWAGGYSVWHEQPIMTVPSDSQLKEGQKVLVSYYHPAFIYDDVVMCCMSEPKVYDILKWQAKQVHDNLQPDGYFMSHDEIRCQGWDESCKKRDMTPGQILADNVKKCVDILREVDPEKPIYVWSDMFDPYHNAGRNGWYYLVNGENPWVGSWEGLDSSVIIVNWNSDKSKRIDSMKHFASRGHKQILAGYYDSDPQNIVPWLKDSSSVDGVIGVMYTTWRSYFDDLESFAKYGFKR